MWNGYRNVLNWSILGDNMMKNDNPVVVVGFGLVLIGLAGLFFWILGGVQYVG